jgi:hypothetical protein
MVAERKPFHPVPFAAGEGRSLRERVGQPPSVGQEAAEEDWPNPDGG